MADQQPATPTPAPAPPSPDTQPSREWTDKDIPAPSKEHEGKPPGTV